MKQIEEFPDYFVNETGEIWSKSYHLKKNKNCELRKLKPSLNIRDGYLIVSLMKDGKKYTKNVHRLVALTLISNSENLEQVNHINGIKTDNSIQNLEWCSPSHNTKHSFDMGLQKPKIGEEVGNSKLIEEQVIEIRELYRTGNYTQKQLGEMFGVSRSLICFIVRNRNWTHI